MDESSEKNTLEVYIQSRLAGGKKGQPLSGGGQLYHLGVVRQSLEQKKDSILQKAARHLEMAKSSSKKAQQSYPRGKNTALEQRGKPANNVGMPSSLKRGTVKAHPVLVHQPTSESLACGPGTLHGFGSPSTKDKPVTFDHRLNNKFKMIDFFEHDAKLLSQKKEYRVVATNTGKTERVQEGS